jgi:hypothetical protein
MQRIRIARRDRKPNDAPMGIDRGRYNRRSQPENTLSLEGWWARLVLSIQ